MKITTMNADEQKVRCGDDFKLVLELETRLGNIRGLAGMVGDAASSDCLSPDNVQSVMSVLTDIVDESVNLINGWHNAKTFEKLESEGRLNKVATIAGESIYKIDSPIEGWFLVLEDGQVMRLSEEEGGNWLEAHQQSAA